MQTVATTIVKLVTITATNHHQRPRYQSNSKLIHQIKVINQLAIQGQRGVLTRSPQAAEKTIRAANIFFSQT